MSNQAYNAGLFLKCRSSLFWLSFLTGILLPKEKTLELINCTQRFGLCRFSLGKNHSSYVFLNYFPSLSEKNICTFGFAVKIKNSMCFCHRCIAFKLMLFSTSFSSAIYFSPVSIIINLKLTQLKKQLCQAEPSFSVEIVDRGRQQLGKKLQFSMKKAK